ncbi:MAG: dTMP kinase [Candidatus Ventricola sp.]
MRYTTILFDLDGTLTRSEQGITRSALYAAEKLGFTGLTQEQFKAFIGPPLFLSFKEIVGMNDEQAQRATELYRERFAREGYAENEVYEGIPTLLRSLKKNGAKIAIATAKPQVFAERIAKLFGLAPYLDAIVGPGFEVKHADKSDIVRRAVALLGGTPVMIGDRRYDIEGGRSNGIDTVGVAYGYGSAQELEDAGATHVVDTVEELTALLLGDAPREKGVFISMEGMDGCGKTTQREALIAHLRQRGWQVCVTREPGGDEVAEKIRALVLDPANAALCDEAEAYLYAASRAQNVRALVRPALERGCAVVCDRFVDSSVAYQGGGRALGVERIAQLNALAVGGTMPDVTVYLRMPPEKALARRLSASEPDRLERQQESFYRRTFEAYETLYADGLSRVVTVDASQPIEAVTRDMLAAVDARLDAR